MCRGPSTPSSTPPTCPTCKPVPRSATGSFNFCWPAEESFVDEKQRYVDGLKVRREVLGDAHVDRSLNALTEFNSEIQEMLMQSAIYCGIPAANATFHLAESVWDELGVESRQQG